MIVLLFGCPSKSPTNLYKSWDTSEQSYEITIEYKNSSEAMVCSADVFQRIDVRPIAKEKQQTSKQNSCNVTVDQFFRDVEVDVKEKPTVFYPRLTECLISLLP